MLSALRPVLGPLCGMKVWLRSTSGTKPPPRMSNQEKMA